MGEAEESGSAIDPRCFGKTVTDHEKARRREEERLYTAKLLVKSEHRCRLCGFTSEYRDVFIHVTKEHPEKGLPDLQIVSFHRCDVCERVFDWWSDAVRHVLLLSGKAEWSDSLELKRLRKQHRKAMKGPKHTK